MLKIKIRVKTVFGDTVMGSAAGLIFLFRTHQLTDVRQHCQQLVCGGKHRLVKI